MNADKANPTIPIKCKDRVRYFSLDLRAFNAVEEHFAKQTGISDYSILADFPWQKLTVRHLSVLIWAGFLTDARQNNETFTFEEAEEVIDIFGLLHSRAMIAEALKKAMPGTEEVEKLARLIGGNESSESSKDSKKKTKKE